MTNQKLGLVHPKIKSQGTFSPPPSQSLNSNSQIGDYVDWNTLRGVTYVGILREWDSNVAIVELNDGTMKPVEC